MPPISLLRSWVIMKSVHYHRNVLGGGGGELLPMYFLKLYPTHYYEKLPKYIIQCIPSENQG